MKKTGLCKCCEQAPAVSARAQTQRVLRSHSGATWTRANPEIPSLVSAEQITSRFRVRGLCPRPGMTVKLAEGASGATCQKDHIIQHLMK
jgi:hypothetical protein